MDLDVFKQKTAFEADIAKTTVRTAMIDLPQFLQDEQDRFRTSLDLE